MGSEGQINIDDFFLYILFNTHGLRGRDAGSVVDAL